LEMDPMFGTVQSGQTREITLSFEATKLLPGEYSVNLLVENNQPQRGPVVIPVRLTVGETAVEEDEPVGVPAEYDLSQNYPNPFNPSTDIKYQIPDVQLPVHTVLRIYNILGQEVRTLVDEVQEVGYYTVTWDGRDGRGNEVPTGIYFYQLTAGGTSRHSQGDFHRTRKMILLK
jgi:hypothetical protein